jgi:PncC family amidohydrolase
MIEYKDLEQIIATLRAKNLTIATAESCTGGMVASELTTVPGSSLVVRGGVVAYQIAAKRDMLGLASVNEENVVSAKTAADMAQAARECFQAQVGVGTTGYLDGDTPHAFWEVQWEAYKSQPNYLKGKIQFPLGNHRRGANRLMVVQEVVNALLSISPGGIEMRI